MLTNIRQSRNLVLFSCCLSVLAANSALAAQTEHAMAHGSDGAVEKQNRVGEKTSKESEQPRIAKSKKVNSGKGLHS